ncbi:MAG: response regulator, partial [Bdellovibrionia bacterium]
VLGEEERKLVGTIFESGQILLNLINDILDFSRMEAGKMDLEVIPFSPLAVLESHTEILAAKARKKQLLLATFVSSDIPPALLGDPGRLGQILLNLMGNAVKFTSRGKVVVRIDLDPKPPTSDEKYLYLRFSVKDTGIGLSKSTQKRLFQPFVQGDGSTVRKFGGTGLGLSICKRIVELMSGQIGIDSEENNGSTFWFTARFGIPQDLIASKEDARGAVGPLKILVVEDDLEVREILAGDFQSNSNYQIDFSTVEDASIVLQEKAEKNESYDIAFLNQSTSALDVFELSKKIQTNSLVNKTKLILLTSLYDFRALMEKAYENGFSGCLNFPFKRVELFNCLEKVMKASSTDSPEGIEKKSGLATQGTFSSDLEQPEIMPERILVAEDNRINQMITVKQLKKLGYVAHTVANGQEAVEAVSRIPYDLVLMDCQMPEMDGFEATRLLRKNELDGGKSHMRIIALTAHALAGDKEKCITAGMDDYLCKPITVPKLAEVIKRNLPTRT